MSGLSVNGKPVHYDSLIKLDPSRVDAAVSKAIRGNADTIIFEVGRDTYAATGRGFDESIHSFDPVRLDDLDGSVKTTYQSQNSFGEGFVNYSPLGLVGAPLGAYSPMLFNENPNALAALSGAVLPSLIGGIYSQFRPIDTNLSDFAAVEYKTMREDHPDYRKMVDQTQKSLRELFLDSSIKLEEKSISIEFAKSPDGSDRYKLFVQASREEGDPITGHMEMNLNPKEGKSTIIFLGDELTTLHGK